MDPEKWRSSPIWMTVRDIFGGQDQIYKRVYKAVIHTKNQDYPAYKVISVDTVRDYHSAMMDDVMIRIIVPAGDYAYLIYPNKDNLEVTLTKRYLNTIGDGESTSSQIEEIRYKAIFDPKNHSFTGSDLGNYSQSAMNSANFIEFKLRLMDRNVEPLRIITTQGVFRGVTNTDIITAALLSASQDIIVDGSPAVSGLDLVTPDFDDPISQLVIPSGTYICSIPTMLQEQIQGVYKYGIGTFYQRFNNEPMWFVYPLFDFGRFDSGKEKNLAVFYGAPPKFSSNVERTFRIQGGVLQAVITTNKVQKNSTDVTQLNHGVGYRFVDQNAFMKKPVMIDDTGQAIAARGNLNTEMGFISREDGLNYAPVVKNFSTNGYHEMSKASARQTTIVQFIWENGDASLIYPGMPCRYCYMQDNDVTDLKGTILGVHESNNRIGNLAQPDRYTSRCVLSIATELNTKLPEYDQEQSFDPTSS